MSNVSVSIKVVSQLCKLEYHGVAQPAESAAASRMNALLLGKTARISPINERNSQSYTLFSSVITSDEGNQTPERPIAFTFKEALEMFQGFASEEATRARRSFFTAVENGKKALRAKYGEEIPRGEILSLAKETRALATTVWKHQVVTTRTETQPFEGSRPNKGGTYTATVKSKTIYTFRPLTEDQITSLKSVILGLKKASETGHICKRYVETPLTGSIRTWVSDTGAVIFKEPKQRLSPSSS